MMNFSARVFENLNGHELAREREVGPTVAVKIGKKGIGDHADIFQKSGRFIRKPSLSIIF